jgi:hypothetical protein
MPRSNYDKGFIDGVSIKNIPIEITQSYLSNVFWVDSVTGSNSNRGTLKYPVSTLAFAISLCKENNGDLIFVAEGHSEDIIVAGGINLNKSGVTIVFLGNGSKRGTINFKTAVTSSMTMTAANTVLVNPRFTAGIDALTSPISITAADCSIINGTWGDGTAIDTTDCIVATTAAARLTIDGWKYYAGTETGTQKNSQIKLTAVDNPVLSNIDIAGNFLVANINNATTACTNMRLENVILKNSNATPKPGIVFQAACTGQAKNVDIRIASGGTFISSLANINFDDNCRGYAAAGYGANFT